MEKNNKLTAAIINFIVIVIAAFQPFMSFDTQEFLTGSIKGYYSVMIGCLLFIYAHKVKSKMVTILAYLFATIGFVTTFTKVYEVVNDVKGILSVEYGLGFYLYISTAIIFIITIFIPNMASKEVKNQGSITTNDHLNIDVTGIDPDSFHICNMILGIKDIPFHSVVLLKHDSDRNVLSLEYSKEKKIMMIKIPVSNIQELSFKSDISISYVQQEKNSADIEAANELLVYSLIGTGIPGILGANLVNSLVTDYQKPDLTVSYLITVKCLYQTELIEIKLTTKKKPEAFISRIKQNQNVQS
ncbi:MAG: hypothetical protein PUB18_04845 [bacterium]|nr:hypothetical protein [bacterium]